MYKDSTIFNVVVCSLLPLVKKCFCLTVLEYRKMNKINIFFVLKPVKLDLEKN
jgi:hypothetical protein